MKNRIKERRTEIGLTLDKLSKKSGISSRRLSDIELDKCNTTHYTLESIATALDTTIAYLLFETDIKEKRPQHSAM